jgi:hypothetical protein
VPAYLQSKGMKFDRILEHGIAHSLIPALVGADMIRDRSAAVPDVGRWHRSGTVMRRNALLPSSLIQTRE